MSEAAPNGAGETGAEERQSKRKHIFVVNGDPDFLDAVRQLLQSESYNVTTTNFVPETFHQIVALKPDVAIIDLVVAERAGWRLLERLHDDVLTSGIPVVVVATDRRLLEEARARTTQFGGQRFIAKPFDIDDVLGAIEELAGTA